MKGVSAACVKALKISIIVTFTIVYSIMPFFGYLQALLFARHKINNVRVKKLAAQGIQHPTVLGAKLVHEYHTCEGLRIHVARAGQDPSKKLILFLHGWPEFWYSWRAQLVAFSTDYEVAAMDMPGFNASDKPYSREAYISQNVSKVVAALLKSLGRQQCILVGHDAGAAMACDFAAMFPARVSHLVLLSVPPSPQWVRQMDARQRGVSTYMYQFNAPWLPEKVLALGDFHLIRHMYTDPEALGGGLRRVTATDTEIEAFKDAMAAPGSLTGGLNFYRGAMWSTAALDKNELVRSAWKLNPQLKMPLLMVMGDADTAVLPNLLCRVGEVAPNSVIRVLPNCSHWIQQDAADEFNELMSAFLKKPTQVL